MHHGGDEDDYEGESEDNDYHAVDNDSDNSHNDAAAAAAAGACACTPRSGDLDSLFASYAKEISNNHKSRQVRLGYHATASMLRWMQPVSGVPGHLQVRCLSHLSRVVFLGL